MFNRGSEAQSESKLISFNYCHFTTECERERNREKCNEIKYFLTSLYLKCVASRVTLARHLTEKAGGSGEKETTPTMPTSQ